MQNNRYILLQFNFILSLTQIKNCLYFRDAVQSNECLFTLIQILACIMHCKNSPPSPSWQACTCTFKSVNLHAIDRNICLRAHCHNMSAILRLIDHSFISCKESGALSFSYTFTFYLNFGASVNQSLCLLNSFSISLSLLILLGVLPCLAPMYLAGKYRDQY